MKIVVQKFGGTSVATAETRLAVIEKIKNAITDGVKPVVVVSAMGRKGDPYATDTLIDVLRQSNSKAAAHEMDMIMSCGEIISAAVTASELQKAGINAISLTGGQAGIVTDSNYGNAAIVDVKAERILKWLDMDMVPVVCGFQGCSGESKLIATLGRGGSDTTAVALACALDADAVEIYTDVDGIMTADPRFVDNPCIMERVPYGAVCDLAAMGARVIHQRAVELARDKNIPIHIKCTFDDCPGTLITGENTFMFRRSGELIENSKVSGVTYIDGITQVIVELDETHKGEELFQALNKSNVNVNCLDLSLKEAMFALYEGNICRCRMLLDKYGFKYTMKNNCARVSVVGRGINDTPTLLSTVLQTLKSYDIKILQTVNSNTTISALIESEDLKKAINVLHKAFKL